jgi:sigma-E factor negative regulatory protein RseA
MDKMDNNQELISALADGQLRGEALARGVQLAASAEGRQAWHAYHVVGEVLRSGRACVGSPPDAFLDRLQLRLREEPLLAEPVVQAVPAVLPVDRPAANDWLWKLVAGVASVAAVTAVGWNMYGSLGGSGAGPQLAAAPAQVVPVAADPRATAMIRDPRLDQLLAAHRQLGGATALQQSSGFLRNATFEGPAR